MCMEVLSWDAGAVMVPLNLTRSSAAKNGLSDCPELGHDGQACVPLHQQVLNADHPGKSSILEELAL